MKGEFECFGEGMIQIRELEKNEDIVWSINLFGKECQFFCLGFVSELKRRIQGVQQQKDSPQTEYG